jgi:hypothetical protein
MSPSDEFCFSLNIEIKLSVDHTLYYLKVTKGYTGIPLCLLVLIQIHHQLKQFQNCVCTSDVFHFQYRRKQLSLSKSNTALKGILKKYEQKILKEIPYLFGEYHRENVVHFVLADSYCEKE